MINNAHNSHHDSNPLLNLPTDARPDPPLKSWGFAQGRRSSRWEAWRKQPGESHLGAATGNLPTYQTLSNPLPTHYLSRWLASIKLPTQPNLPTNSTIRRARWLQLASPAGGFQGIGHRDIPDPEIGDNTNEKKHIKYHTWVCPTMAYPQTWWFH